MRQFIALAVIAAIVFSVASPTLAQRTPRTLKPATVGKKITPASSPVSTVSSDSKGGFADFGVISASTPGSGAIISWTMRSETKVGFYQVYRIDPKQGRVAVGQPVIGAGGKTNFDTRWGESYSAFDPDGTADSLYEIEAISTEGGAKLASAQFAAKFQKGAALAVESAQQAAEAQAVSSIIQTSAPAAANAPTAAPNLTMQRFIASQPGAKIAVSKEGLYRVSRAELTAAGFFNIPASSSSSNWRLFVDGNEQAIIVGAGDQYIEFYGRGTDTAESDTKVYYLLAYSDPSPALRMQTRVMRSFGGTAFQPAFRATTEMREKINYLSKIFNGDTSNYWGNLVSTGLSTRVVYLPNVDTTSQDSAVVNVRLQGYSSALHNQQVSFNGHVLSGTVSGAYQENYAADFTIPMSWLVEGNNTFTLQTTPTSNSGDYCLFDTIKVTYAQKFRAYQNVAKVFSAGRRKVTLDGFSSPTVATVTVPTTLQAGPAASSSSPTSIPSAGPGMLRLSPNILAGTQPNPAAGQPALKVARITVSRVFGSTGAVTADLTLTDGTATGGSSCTTGVDYIFPSSPTVTLSDGVVSKDVDIQICSGNIADPNGETFTATLSNPTGGATFPTSNIRLFDISYDAPQIVSGATLNQSGNNYSLTIPSYRGASLYALDEAYDLQASSVTANTPSTLSTTTNTAAMLIITNSSLRTKADEWANYRRSSTGGSFTVNVVDVEDLYDEYNYGTLSANSIKDFLTYAYSSPTPPSYVLLFGDASYDPRNYEGRQMKTNLVPTKLVDLVFDEAPSDDALADVVASDGLADIPIGRIPVIDNTQADLIFTKMKNQELPAMQSFSRGALFVNDNPYGYDFAAINQSLRNELPPDMPTTVVSRGNDPTNNTQDPNSLPALIAALNTGPTGPYIVNWAGHGASGVWGSSAWFTSGNVAQLTHPENQGIFTMLTCLNGLFNKPAGIDSNTRQEVQVNCLAEVLLKSSGGGSSISWASTTETTADIQQTMAQDFYHELNAGTMKRIGDLIKHSKGQIQGGSDVRYSWELLGDPATKIR